MRAKMIVAAWIVTLVSMVAMAEFAVAPTAEEVRPLNIGNEIPDVTVQSLDGEAVPLREPVSEAPTVLIFYRGGWCPYCMTHLSAIAQTQSELREMGYQIVGISPDRPEKLRESVEGEELSYTLLSDSPMAAAKAFGIAFQVDDETIELYQEYGIDLEDASGENHHLLPVASVFILNTDGIIQFHYVNPDYTVRLDPDVLLAVAKAGANS